MVIYIPAGILFAYLLFRLILPLPWSPTAKTSAGMALLLASQEHLLNTLIFGSLSSPEAPSFLLMVQGGLFVSVLLLFVCVLARDIFRVGLGLVRYLAGGSSSSKTVFSPERRRFLATGLRGIPVAYGLKRAALSGVFLAPAAYGVEQAAAVPAVQHTEATLPGLPKELDGVTLVQLSDMHISPLLQKGWVNSVVERVNAVKPDVILFTGDMADGFPSQRMESFAPLRTLTSRHGVFACVGNHEYYSDFHAWMEIFPQLGIRMLCNSHVTLPIAGRELVVAGVTDPVAERFALPGPDLQAALRGAPEGAVRVLLDHRPGNAVHNAKSGVDLQLSGHTHGGMVYGMGGMVARFNQGYVRGWYNVQGMPLYVSSGAGIWNGFPVRIGVPSEIAHLTLRCAGAQ